MSELDREGSGERLRQVLGSDALRLVAATAPRAADLQIRVVLYMATALLVLNVGAAAALLHAMSHVPEVRAIDQSGRVWEIPALTQEAYEGLRARPAVPASPAPTSTTRSSSALPGPQPSDLGAGAPAEVVASLGYPALEKILTFALRPTL